MRVLAVGNMYPPHHLGGYELVWRAAMRHVRSQGHEVRVLTSDVRLSQAGHDDQGHGDAGQDDPDTFRELRWYWRDHAWPRIGWRSRVALERHNAHVLDQHLQELQPDVVSWWSMGGMSLSLIERVRRMGLPAVAFVHDDWLVYAPKVDRWTRPFRRHPVLARLAERATGLPARADLERGVRYVLVSETVRRRARQEGYALRDSTIASSGVEAGYLDPRPALPWRWRLLYAGRLDERKGVDDAVAALRDLPAQATLTVVGGGGIGDPDRLRSHADAFGVSERLRLLGMRSREELRAEYEASDAVLFPVRWREPWGLVPLEAMGLGRPVIATGDGGPGEYLSDGENCVIVAPEDPPALARAVRRLASDDRLRERLRSGGLQTARLHTEAAFNAAVLEALNEALRPSAV